MNFKSVFSTLFSALFCCVAATNFAFAQFTQVAPPAHAKELAKQLTKEKVPTKTQDKQIVLSPNNAVSPPAATLTTAPATTTPAQQAAARAGSETKPTQKYVMRKAKNLKTGQTSETEYMKKEEFDALTRGDASKTGDGKLKEKH